MLSFSAFICLMSYTDNCYNGLECIVLLNIIGIINTINIIQITNVLNIINISFVVKALIYM